MGVELVMYCEMIVDAVWMWICRPSLWTWLFVCGRSLMSRGLKRGRSTGGDADQGPGWPALERARLVALALLRMQVAPVCALP